MAANDSTLANIIFAIFCKITISFIGYFDTEVRLIPQEFNNNLFH